MDNNTIISGLLDYLNKNPALPINRHEFYTRGLKINDFNIYEPITQELIEDNILKEHSPDDDRIVLTPFGRKIAKMGYENYLKQLNFETQQDEKVKISEKRKNRITFLLNILTVIATILGLWAVFKPDDSDNLKNEIIHLNIRIDSLSNIMQQDKIQQKLHIVDTLTLQKNRATLQ